MWGHEQLVSAITLALKQQEAKVKLLALIV